MWGCGQGFSNRYTLGLGDLGGMRGTRIRGICGVGCESGFRGFRGLGSESRNSRIYTDWVLNRGIRGMHGKRGKISGSGFVFGLGVCCGMFLCRGFFWYL